VEKASSNPRLEDRMRKPVVLAAALVAALALAGTAAAALVPWTFVGAGAVCSPTSTFSGGHA
jgi:hypothetical protein